MKYLDKLRNLPIVEKIGVFGILSTILWTVQAREVYSSPRMLLDKTITLGRFDFVDLGITLVIQFVILIIVFGGKKK